MYGDAGVPPARSRDGLLAAVAAVLIASLAVHGSGTVALAAIALPGLAVIATAIALVAIVGVARRRARTTPAARVDVAVESERRRIARDIHDDLAQDLAFIAARVRVLERDPAAPVRLDHLVTAADRALEHSRTTIATLTRPLDEPLDAALARNATEVAERHGGRADLWLQAGITVAPATRESLTRIVREAVTNAMRHGRAGRVEVSLEQEGTLRLRIADDGCGFDVAAREGAADAGFGLLAMQERARALGGALSVRSEPGAGATIEIALPCPAT
jgi:signal transduction histidine kinase